MVVTARINGLTPTLESLIVSIKPRPSIGLSVSPFRTCDKDRADNFQAIVIWQTEAEIGFNRIIYESL